MSVGYLADSFDLINVRDLDLIAQARARCARLVVGVFTDEYVERVSDGGRSFRCRSGWRCCGRSAG